MRVAVFTDTSFDAESGATTALRAVLRHAPPGLDVRIYTVGEVGIRGDQYLALPSIGAAIPYHPATRVYWPRARRLGRELRARGVNVIHLATPGPVGLAGRWIAHRLRLPLSASYHAHLGERAEMLSRSRRLGAWLERYARWFYAPCEPLFVPSAATRTMLASHGYHTNRCRVWIGGVDASLFSPERRSAAVRDAWRVDDRRPAVLYVGRASPEKGIALLPEIQRVLDAAHVAHRLIVAGTGPALASLRDACPDAVFLGDLVPDTLAVAMASADVLVSPGGTDASGQTVLEAQAAGLPAIVTDRGGPREQIEDGVTGYACRAGDAGDLASRLVEVLRLRARRAEMSAAARDRVKGRDWPATLAPVYTAWRDAARRLEAPAPWTVRQPGSL